MDYIRSSENRTSVEWIHQYLESLSSPSTRRALSAALLRHLPILEDSVDKPVYQMDAAEAITALSAMNEREYATLLATASFMRSFISWLRANDLIEQSASGFSDCDIYQIDTTNAVRSQLFGSIAEVLGWILPYQSFTSGNAAVLASLYWCGLTTDEILNLKAIQVDLCDRVIHLQDRDVILTDRIVVNGLADYARTGSFTRYTQRVSHWYACPSNGLFIKRFTISGEGEPIDKLMIHNVFSKLRQKDAGLERLTVPAIFDSGAYSRLRRVEEVRELTPQDFVEQCRIVDKGWTVANQRAGYAAYRKVFG